jgi:hypothetical protein
LYIVVLDTPSFLEATEILLVSAKVDLIKREIEVSSEKVELHIPHDKCCIYENERLI